jgi:hypothetical protein
MVFTPQAYASAADTLALLPKKFSLSVPAQDRTRRGDNTKAIQTKQLHDGLDETLVSLLSSLAG